MPNQSDNITMSGGGLYSLATTGAKDVIDIATPRVLAAITDMDLPQDTKKFTMADMGCADGGTSLDMVRGCISQLKKISPNISATVVYADQPANDFNALVSIVNGRTQFKTWLGQHQDCYALFSGASFYLQAVPDNTLDFAFSATAMHWLSKLPCQLSSHVHMVGASGDEYNAFTNQAKQDWQTILMHRSRELKSGGKMILVNFCRDKEGHYLGNTGGINMFDTMAEIWREFVASNKISEAEFKNMTLPQYYNTVEQFSAPLIDPANPCHQSGLRLVDIETTIVPCPFAAQYKIDNDLEKFADGLIGTIRSWNQSIYAAGLNSNRPEQERHQLVEDYYNAYKARIIKDPTDHGMSYVHAYMTISKD